MCVCVYIYVCMCVYVTDFSNHLGHAVRATTLLMLQAELICKVGQNCMHTLHMTVSLVISLPKIPHIYRVGQNHIYTVYIRCFWQGNHEIYGVYIRF